MLSLCGLQAYEIGRPLAIVESRSVLKNKFRRFLETNYAITKIKTVQWLLYGRKVGLSGKPAFECANAFRGRSFIYYLNGSLAHNLRRSNCGQRFLKPYTLTISTFRLNAFSNATSSPAANDSKHRRCNVSPNQACKLSSSPQGLVSV